MSAAMSISPPPFLITIIAFLEPWFLGAGIDLAAAQTEIVETLSSYGTRSRAEIIQAAKIIAFSMASLETLKNGTAPDLSPSMRLRYRSCANGLDRSSQQNEKALVARLDCALPEAAEPIDDVSDADAHDAVEAARAGIDGYRNRLAERSPQPTGVHADPVIIRPAAMVSAPLVRGFALPGSAMDEAPIEDFPWPKVKVSTEAEERTKTMWRDAMIKVLGDMGRPVQPVPGLATECSGPMAMA